MPSGRSQNSGDVGGRKRPILNVCGRSGPTAPAATSPPSPPPDSGCAELHTAAIDVVGRQVSTDLTCWATIDPETLVISTMTNGEARIPRGVRAAGWPSRSTSADQPHSFAGLARRGSTVAKLSDMSADDRRRSIRVQTVWRRWASTRSCG